MVKKALQGKALEIEQVRLIADLRIMHAKVQELFEVVSVIKRRHQEPAIREFADRAMLDQDIKRVDELYLWFLGVKEDGIKLTRR